MAVASAPAESVTRMLTGWLPPGRPAKKALERVTVRLKSLSLVTSTPSVVPFSAS